MSLVILSNDASESLRVGQNNSIFKPYSFRNSITSTMEIPENAQVALQSCKIVLDGSVVLEGGRRIFYVYLGEIVDKQATGLTNVRDTIEETLSAPIRYELFPDLVGAKDVSQEEIAAEIKRVLNTPANQSILTQEALVNAGQLRAYTGLFHPDYHNVPGNTRHEVIVKRDAATGASEGYEIILNFQDGLQNMISGAVGAGLVVNTHVDCSTNEIARRTQFVLGGIANLGIPPGLQQNYTVSNGGGAQVGLSPIGGANTFPAGAAAFVPQETMGTTFDINPITLTGGRAIFDVSQCTFSTRGNKAVRFACGLTRMQTTPCVNQNGESQTQLGPRDFNVAAGKAFWRGDIGAAPAALQDELDWIPTFLDYAVVVTDAGLLRVLQCVDGLENRNTADFVNDPAVRTGGGGGARGGYKGHKWLIVDYTVQHGAAPFNAHYDMKTNVGDLNEFTFTTDGSKVKIEANFAGGGGIPAGAKTLIEFNANFARITQNLKPIDQACQSLQPFMMLNFDEDIGAGLGAQPTDASTINIRMMQFESSQVGLPNVQAPSVMPSYYNMLMERNTAQTIGQFKSLSRRWKNIPIAAGFLPYPGYDRATHSFDELRPVLIVAPSGAYSPSPGANVRDLFGFSDMTAELDSIPPWVADSYDAGTTRTSQKISSTSVPIAVSTKSIFVRLDNFNTKAMNAGNGNPSRIIAHLPRFDGQNETGRLFFEPSTLVYVDLHNAQPLKINQIDTSFVYGDESLCKALTGTSIVVLHFRKKE